MEKKKVTADDMMTHLSPDELVSINANEKVADAFNKIKESKKKKIIVVDNNNNPVKVLDLSDIVGKALTSKLGELDLKPVVTIDADREIDENALKDLSKSGILLAVRNQTPIGVLTPADIARYWKNRI